MRCRFIFSAVFYSSLLFSLVCCKKNDLRDLTTEADKVEITNTPVLAQGGSTYKLNVVYFVPRGQAPLPDYQKRYSEILLYFQDFYGDQMQRNGFGYKTFGLQTDTSGKKVIMSVVNGKYPRTKYKYNGGSGPMMEEINAYFSQHPLEKRSEHYLIIAPVPDINNADVPFYGIGNWAFVLDHDKFDITKYGVGIHWLAGTAHELGHGLGLPHDKEKVSEANTIGTSVMSSTNFASGAILTNAATAILNNCQLFNNTVSNYQQPVKTYAKTLNISYANGKMIISGRFYADKEINGINIYQNPDAANDAYDSPSWSVKPINSDSFYVETPISELWTPSGSYTLYVQVLAVNGTRQTIGTYQYFFNNQVPVLDPAIGSKPEIEKAGWTVLDVDSEESGYSATNVLDKDPTTFWHTQYSGSEPNHPHQLTIDMHQASTLNGLTFRDRQNVWPGIKDLEVFVKTETGIWTSAGVFTLRKSDLSQFITFSQPLQARYFRIITANSYDNGSSCALAEIGAY